MQVVGEKLSRHVLANYEEFVRGVNEVASIEKDLQVAKPSALCLHEQFIRSADISSLPPSAGQLI